MTDKNFVLVSVLLLLLQNGVAASPSSDAAAKSRLSFLTVIDAAFEQGPEQQKVLQMLEKMKPDLPTKEQPVMAKLISILQTPKKTKESQRKGLLKLGEIDKEFGDLSPNDFSIQYTINAAYDGLFLAANFKGFKKEAEYFHKLQSSSAEELARRFPSEANSHWAYAKALLANDENRLKRSSALRELDSCLKLNPKHDWCIKTREQVNQEKQLNKD